MKQRIIVQLRKEIAELKARIAQGGDYTGTWTNKAAVLLAELDKLTQA